MERIRSSLCVLLLLEDRGSGILSLDRK